MTVGQLYWTNAVRNYPETRTRRGKKKNWPLVLSMVRRSQGTTDPSFGVGCIETGGKKRKKNKNSKAEVSETADRALCLHVPRAELWHYLISLFLCMCVYILRKVRDVTHIYLPVRVCVWMCTKSVRMRARARASQPAARSKADEKSRKLSCYLAVCGQRRELKESNGANRYESTLDRKTNHFVDL